MAAAPFGGIIDEQITVKEFRVIGRIRIAHQEMVGRSPPVSKDFADLVYTGLGFRG